MVPSLYQLKEANRLNSSENAMRHSRPRRILILAASACVLLALGCGLFGTAVQQGVITARNIDVQLGPLVLVGRVPRWYECPPQPQSTSNLCYLLRSASGPSFYRMWLIWYIPERNVQSTRVLAHWRLPLREEPDNPNNHQ